MKGFGGEWTEKKIEILVEYAKAYLKITKVQSVSVSNHIAPFIDN